MCRTYLTSGPETKLKGSENTIAARVSDLADFHHFLDAQKTKVAKLETDTLKKYAHDLSTSKSAATGEQLSGSTMARRWSSVTKFVLHCQQKGYLKNSIPTGTRTTRKGDVDYLVIDHDLPAAANSDRQITALHPETLQGVLNELGSPVIEVVDLRVQLCRPSTTDRLMAEVAANAGLRRTEVCNLRITTIRTHPRTELDPISKLSITVLGKGKKKRSVPFPIWLLDALERYAYGLRAAAVAMRQQLTGEPDHGYLFVHATGNKRYIGNRITPQVLDRHFAMARQRYLDELSKREEQIHYQLASAEIITPHALRHTFAITTFVVRQQGGDAYPTKYVSGVLGHADTDTTERIYLRSVEAFESKIRERIRQIQEQRPHMRLGDRAVAEYLGPPETQRQ